MTLDELIAAEGLPADYGEVIERHWRPLADALAARGARIVGINGAQGSGKTTLCRFLELLLAERGVRAVALSLDDFYLTKAERATMAQDEHRLFATRGVPGTHDVALGEAAFDALLAGRPATVPRFDKATDDRAGSVTAGPPVDIVLFEGWCVGAVPQPAPALRVPANQLEAKEDADVAWRREVNRRLATDYAEWFGRIDMLVMLKIAGWEAVRANRARQEAKLGSGPAVMDDAALDNFLMHYERLTCWQLEEMPARADILIPIGLDQRPQ